MLRCVVILAGGLLVASANAQEPTPFDSDQGKLSYALDAQMGKDLRDQSVEVREAALAAGRDPLIELWREDKIGDDVLIRLEREIDLAEARLARED